MPSSLSRSRPALGTAASAHLCPALTEASPPVPCSHASFVLRDGMHGLEEVLDRGTARARRSHLHHLGECAAATCGCNRVKVPGARESFERTVCAHAEANAQAWDGTGDEKGLVYASLGSGYMLSDAILIDKLLRLPGEAMPKYR